MSIITEVRQEREDLARVLKKHTGIRKIVEDLYPDSAHFIYELLQNAEDTGATEATFTLEGDLLIFEHDGRPFDKDDILAITDIGEGTKAEDKEKIGRFGIGFKAVFAYTETPSIWSPTFSFKISDLVLPDELPSNGSLGQKTRFEFPFNNPKKEPDSAYDEIGTGLGELAETTLLFLANLESINWRIGDADEGTVLRIQHSDHHLEVLKQVGGTTTESSHFLKFAEPVEGLEKQNVAVAFELDFLPDIKKFEFSEPIAKQLRITSASPGRVAVFFPADKETSGLRFHLHAPFVPELSRASVKETPANEPLFCQLAALATSSLHQIRDLGLLSREFLAVLPNSHDEVRPRYGCIRDAIVEEMNSEPLTPVHGGNGHAPASKMLQARVSLKNLLTDEDLDFLHGTEKHWAVSPTQRNNEVDRFLQQLDIAGWDVDKFLSSFNLGFLYKHCFDRKAFYEWLSNKSLEWHQQLYAALLELENQNKLHQVKDKAIVRIVNGKYRVGKDCFFSSAPPIDTDLMPRVDAGVYTSGKNKKQQEDARKLLEAIGVREVGEREQVEVLLKSSYGNDKRTLNEREHLAHMRRFVKLLEDDPSSASLLSSFPLFMGKDNKWHKASEIYLCEPYLDTGLDEYVDIGGASDKLTALADIYQSPRIDTAKVVKFAEKLGAITRIQITQTDCRKNPRWDYLRSVGGERHTTPIDRDYVIDHFHLLVARKSEKLAKLVWDTMCSLRDTDYGYDSAYRKNPLRAVYQKNERGGSHLAASQMVHQLRNEEWVPQRGGEFVRPAQAQAELLPDGFTFDAGWAWIKAIQFGEDIQLQNARARAETAAANEQLRKKEEAAEALGFEDDESLHDAQEFAALPPEDRKKILDEYRDCNGFELPEQEPSNPNRRAQRVGAMATEAPGRRTEVRNRSVSVGLDGVKEEAGQYLSQQYTNPDGEMICQVCKEPLPFKLDDGRAYFEKVEFLPTFKKRHNQNYLALCPNHAAMFKHANGSPELMHDMFVELDENELEVVLAQQDATIYFTKTHLSDLRALMQAENEHADSDGDE